MLSQRSALIFGLQPDLATDLARILGQISITANLSWEAADLPLANYVFCSADPQIVVSIRAACPDAPIVVVSRGSEIAQWLDCIEAGATDYCGAPFDVPQLRWLVNSFIDGAARLEAA